MDNFFFVLREATPSCMAASNLNTIFNKGEFSLAQWLLYWLFVWATQFRISPGPYVSVMHLFICYFIKDHVHQTGHRAINPIKCPKMDFLSNKALCHQ